MKTVGIIVEYNPLHYGHIYHFRQSLHLSGANSSIAVMSGNFLQRGEPALVNKWARTEMALHMGVDLVIELPVAYAASSAEVFAQGAATLLDATGIVDSLCFGSESGEIKWLQQLASLLAHEPASFQARIRAHLQTGMSYPSAYSSTVLELGQANPDFTDDLQHLSLDELAKPNNTLGLHYLIALQRLNSTITPMTVTRQKAGYHQTDITDQQIASATAIRKLLFEQRNLHAAKAYLPEFTYDIIHKEWLAGRAPMQWNNYSRALFHTLFSQSADQLADYYEVTEGLQHRIKQALPHMRDLPLDVEQLLALLKTKRYTRTKLQRTLTRILLGHTKLALHKDSILQGPQYIRVLGFSEKGRVLLKRMKQSAKLPVITKVTQADDPFLTLDIQAASAYSLGYTSSDANELLRDYYQAPIMI